MNETMPKNSDITILCKVVDNFGDIGFVYRLAKNLRKINPRYKIRLVVNDLNSFQKIAPKIKLNSAEQNFCGMKIFNSSAEEICKAEFSKNLPRVILECFQCGRPNWLDEILFASQSQKKICDKKNGDNFPQNESIHIGANSEKIFQIINIDYLTAEDYAEEFHCLKSATRSAFVKKVNFMPGFTAKTGGLILDEPFIANWRAHFEKKSEKEKCENLACDKNVAMQKSSSAEFSAHAHAALSQKILIFSYQKNFSPIIRAFQKICDKNLSQIQIFLAQGIGKESFLETYRKFCDSQKFDLSQIQLNELDFLSQENWDEMLLQMDVLFVRGEDSLARACLCGKPFVWNAYPQKTPQDENYHLVKVRALLEKLRPHFSESKFAIIEKFWLLYNVNACDISSEENLENACFEFLSQTHNLKRIFEKFSESIFALGNFSEKLDAFVQNLQN